MKINYIGIVSLCLLMHSAQGTTYDDKIREIHYDENEVEIAYFLHDDLDDYAASQKDSKYALGGEDASGIRVEYELVAIDVHNISNEFSLDTKTVYVDSPMGDVRLTSENEVTSEPYVRADRPFFANYAAIGIQTDHELAHYNSILLHIETDQGTESSNVKITENTGDTRKELEFTAIDFFDGTDPTAVSGTITVAVIRNDEDVPEDQQDEAPWVFDFQDIVVHPKHSGYIEGIEDGATYNNLPALYFTAKNLYPLSTTVVTLTKEGNSDLEEVVLEGAGGQNNLQNSLKDLDRVQMTRWGDDVVTSDGKWTVTWWLTGTPWDDEIIDQVSFTYKSTIQVRSRVSTSE